MVTHQAPPSMGFSGQETHWSGLPFPSPGLIIFETLHLDVYIFPFILCLFLLFFSQLFLSPPQTTILPFCISFSWGWFHFLGLIWHGNWLSPEQLMPERDKVEATVSFMTQHWKSHSHFCSLLICEPYLFSMEGTTQR